MNRYDAVDAVIDAATKERNRHRDTLIRALHVMAAAGITPPDLGYASNGDGLIRNIKELAQQRDAATTALAAAQFEVSIQSNLKETFEAQLSAAEKEIINLKAGTAASKIIAMAKEERCGILEGQVAQLRAALESTPCKCKTLLVLPPHCPRCSRDLECVQRSEWLNRDQWDAVKSGDWICRSCPRADGMAGLCYWFNNQLLHETTTCARCAALAGTTPAWEPT